MQHPRSVMSRFAFLPPSILFVLSLLLVLPACHAEAQTTPVEGIRDNTPGVHALVGARIVLAPGRVVPVGTLVLRDGLIEAVGADVQAPADAVVHDVAGLTLYPGFLDAYATVGTRKSVESNGERNRGPVGWNPQLRAHRSAADDLEVSEEDARALRSQGFTVAHAVPRLGIFRGTSAVVSLRDGTGRDQLIRGNVAQAVTQRRDARVGNGYPTSPMGGISFIRQTLLDAQWHESARRVYESGPEGLVRPEANGALEALAPAARGDTPLLFEAWSHEEVLRALRFRDEFPIQPWLRGSGSEYRLGGALADLGVPLILPVAFPNPPTVQTPEDALNASLEWLRHWQLAPENPARVAAAGVDFSLTSDGLDDLRDFLPNVRKAVSRGLDPDVALTGLTTGPASLLGVERSHGTLQAGKVANLIVSTGNLFTEEARIREVWVDGRRFPVEAGQDGDPRGRWILVAGETGAGAPTALAVPAFRFAGADTEVGLGGAGPEASTTLEVDGGPGRFRGRLRVSGQEIPLTSFSYHDGVQRLRGAFSGPSLGIDGPVGEIRFTATVSDSDLFGWVELPDGGRVGLRGERLQGSNGTNGASRGEGATGGNGGAGAGNGTGMRPAVAPVLTLPDRYPAVSFGRAGLPEAPGSVLIRNATVWTMGAEGVLEGADLLIHEGRVAEVGRGLQAPAGAVVIDADGKHVTPGLIDPHLHSGADGPINETGGAIVPEVRLGDVLVTDNVWMYRQLAGGLTTAHVMHGSANPIGGQNQAVKMRWGMTAEELKVEGAPRTVKFALGENPVRREDRYPDTRMGTQQIIRDHFLAAREYQQRWQEWESDPRGIPPRRDLRLEALVDILEGRILVQSHGYRADEFLMLVRLAEEFGFRVKAIHHGVEAYKIAPELAAAGVAAVVWTDWSGFKVEAYDATTYNARILHEAGVLTSLHSDDSQIASRMNWEAAKLLRTGLGEEEALAMVTINAARVLGLEASVGSLEAGKDADFVLWSGHPLSAATRAEQTWVDGRKYFDMEEDRSLRRDVEVERALLVQAILNEK